MYILIIILIGIILDIMITGTGGTIPTELTKVRIMIGIINHLFIIETTFT